MSTPAISSMADERETIAFCFESAKRAQRHGDGEDRRHRHRDRGDEQNEHELQDVERVVQAPVVGDDDVSVDLDGDHDQGQRDGER